jgi:hypothetical protein
MNASLDQQTVENRRQESIHKSTDVLFELLKQAETSGINTQYLFLTVGLDFRL